MISLAEESKHEMTKLDVWKTLGLHSENTLSIQSKNRYMSAMPSCVEEFNRKYDVMTSMWQLQSKGPFKNPSKFDPDPN